MVDLPTRLAQGDHHITYRAARGDARAELREAIQRKYVHVLFTETHGGTNLGFPLDETASDLTEADWTMGRGSVRLVGQLNIDGVDVRCVARFDLETVEGRGHLVILSSSVVS